MGVDLFSMESSKLGRTFGCGAFRLRGCARVDCAAAAAPCCFGTMLPSVVMNNFPCFRIHLS